MFHLDNGSGTSTMPPIPAEQNPLPQWFTEGDGNNQNISWPGIHWFNTIQAELLNVLAAAGISPEKAKLTQIAEAIQAIINKTEATTGKPGIVQLSDAINSDSSITAATSKAVKMAYDLANNPPIPVKSVNGKIGDIELVAASVGALSLDDAPDFIILYPNGTAEAPATISYNTRIVVDNPFQNHHVICVAEVLLEGDWGDSGFVMHNSTAYGAFGTRASLLNNDKVVIQTGSSGALGATSNQTGSPFGRVSGGSINSLPFRVKIWKIR